MFMSGIISFFEDIFFPNSCILCKKDGVRLCHTCLHTLRHAPLVCPFCMTVTKEQTTCVTCSKHRMLTSARSLYNYDDPRVKKILQHIKFSGEFALLKNIKNDIWEAFEECVNKKEIDVIIPIPISTERFVERGYNQAELIAKLCSVISGIPVQKSLRTKRQITQHILNREKRLQNLSTHFYAKPLAKSIRHAIVIDDILTTGGTLEAAAIALHKAGIQRVSAFTIARQEKYVT